ncbi:Uncharacterised protein [Streptococcus pneumoniae]|nr:Uncharacterised protein [Streptococcus pneumoniae]
MTLPVRKSLHDAVLQASKADTWEQATKEWNEVSLKSVSNPFYLGNRMTNSTLSS